MSDNYRIPPDDKRPRGEAHPRSKYTAAAVARAKRLLAEAPRITIIADGHVQRISRETGIAIETLRAISKGTRWAHIPPEPATTSEETSA
jgi:hypothetical protein